MHIKKVVVVAALVLTAEFFFNFNSPAWADTNTIVGLVAQQFGLPLVPRNQAPQFATFWEVDGSSVHSPAPLPGPTEDTNFPIYAISADQFIVDASSRILEPQSQWQSLAAQRATNLVLQVSSILDWYAQVQQDKMMSNDGMMAIDSQDSGSGGGYGPLDPDNYDSSTLWLEILPLETNRYNLNTNFVTLLLHNTSPGVEYLLESRPTLTADSVWTPEYTLVAPVTTNILPFTISMIGRPTRFFRAVSVSPVATPTFFGVEQDSLQNQLDIFGDNYDPSDDYFSISSLTAAHHGDINYSLDATVFEYKPNSGFYGTDSFTYSVTNLHGGSATATVTVFVNQSGNSLPSADDVTLVLETNVYIATFNAVANSSDPDGDTISLFAVTAPRYGSVSNDASGNTTYIRNPALYGDDYFTYIVTDGHGGHARGNVLVQQSDTPGTGIPDQWVVNNGMDFTVDNSLDDPDGDGLPNLAEFLLGTNPIRSDNPLNLPTIGNSAILGGGVQLPLAGISPLVPAPAITLRVNGEPAANASLSQGPDRAWLINWDTTHLANGNYSIQVAFQFNPNGSPNFVYGAQTTVTVYNPITFDSLSSRFTDFLLIRATLATTSAHYLVQLYDEYGNPLVSASGNTTDGQIQLGWDLTDGHGKQISFGNIRASFSLTQVGPGPQDAGTSVSQWFLKEPFGNSGPFAVAWGWNCYTTQFYNYQNQMVGNGVVDILGNPSDPNSYSLTPSYNIPLGGLTFRYDTPRDKDTLLSALKQSSEFFWLGHAGFYGIAGNEKRSSIAPSDVTKALANYSFMSNPNHPNSPKSDKHPYKLVVIDGCEVYDSLWAGAFGIDFSSQMSTNIVLDYQFTGRMPRAFVGWTNQVLLPNCADFSGLTHAQFGDALGNLWGDWMAGYPLNFCLDDFEITALSYGFTGQDSWRISGCIDLTRFQ